MRSNMVSLGMSSSMKSTSDGFMAYYKLREERLNHLEGQFIRIQAADHQPHGGGVLRIRIEDSGPGFDYGKTDDKGNLDDFSKFSGRGIPLLRKLCRSVQYFGSGNCVHVEYEWFKGDREHERRQAESTNAGRVTSRDGR